LKITAGPKMASRRSQYAATMLADGRILLTGGLLPAEYEQACKALKAMACAVPPTATAEIYDPRTRSFTPTGSMSHPRSLPQSVLLRDGRVLVVGGEGTSVRTTEVYDPATGRFRDLGAIHQDTSGDAVFPLTVEPSDAWRTQVLDDQTITVLADGRVLIAGGLDDLGDSSNAVTVFDPTTNTFVNLPGMPVRWKGASASLLANGSVLFTGGYDSSTNEATDEALLFNPVTNAFTTTGSTVQARVFNDQTVLRDGRVLISGGVSDPFNPYSGVPLPPELYDPSTGTFSLVDWTTPVWNLKPVRAPDGRVLLLGGLKDGSIERQVYAYDPDSGAVSLLSSSLLPDGSVDCAFVLGDGSILLLVGSYTESGGGAYFLTLGA
jgi:hypothetical protein